MAEHTQKRKPSKTRQAKMRKERMRGTLLFGAKLTAVLALLIVGIHLFTYAKDHYQGGGSVPAAQTSGGYAPEETLPQEDPDETAASSVPEPENEELPEQKKTTPEKTGTEETKDIEKAGIKETAADNADSASKSTSAGNAATQAETAEPLVPEKPDVQTVPQTPAAPPAETLVPIDPAATALEASPAPSETDAPKPMIAFTFDDGPYTKVDTRILDVLEAYGGKATFFIVGSRVNDYKDTLNRIHASGSEIGNHTYDHKNLEKLTPEEVAAQVEMTNDAVEAVTGFRPKLVRVPYGAYKGQVTELVNYPMIQWNVDTEDWSSKNKDAVLASILAHAKDGNIVLMHDLYPSTADAFVEAVPQLAAQGFELVTVSEMYAAKGAALEGGKVYFNIK